MKNIYLIIGPSGVGKTTAVKELEKLYGFKAVKPFTDAPENCQNSGEQTFISTAEFEALHNVCFYSAAKEHRCAVTTEMIDASDVFVTGIYGAEYLRKHYRGNKGIITICLTQFPGVLRERMLSRGDPEEAIEQKLSEDALDFEGVEDIADAIIFAGELDKTVRAVKTCIDNRETRASFEKKILLA